MAGPATVKAARATLHAPASSVTVMEDRAHVTRSGSVALETGTQRLLLAGVAPVLSDKTLMVKFVGDGASLIDARVVRERVVRTDDEDEPDAAARSLDTERAIEALDKRLAVAEAEHALLARETAMVDKVARLAVTELGVDASWAKPVGDDADAVFQSISEQERRLRRAVIEAELGLDELRNERMRLVNLAAVQATPRARAAAWVAVDVQVHTAGEHRVQVEYIVPGACWRPYHTARLAPDGDTMDLRTDACVWQNTGENWSGVQLRLSTERPSLGTEPPDLANDVIRAKKRSDKIQVQARDQTIETAGLGGDDVQRLPEVPGIDDGGEVQLLVARTAASVPSDGRPYRVEISSFSAKATVDLVCMAELAECVVSKTTQVNGGSTPLLAGPVDLIRDSGYVGRTSVLFIAAGERFELGWGPEPTLRVTRETEEHREKSRMLSSWITRAHDVRVHLSNIGLTPRTVRVTERIPVSEIEKLQITPDTKQTRDGAAPDKNGFVEWVVTVPAHGTDCVDLRYTVKKHEDVQGY